MAEALATLRTLCWPLALVCLAVQCQLGAHAEGLATLGALVGLVAGMVAPVHVEVGHACEALAAQLAAIGLLTYVRVPVLGEVRAVTEAAATLGTPEGPLSRVDAHMAPQPCSAAEGLRALCAEVQQDSGCGRGAPLVRPRVVETQHALAEGTSAQRAATGLLRRVRAAPVQQRSWVVRQVAAADVARAGAAAPPVRALVQVEAAAVAEALTTLTADVERRACMSKSVCAQLDGSGAVLFTVRTAEAAIAAMILLVAQQYRTVAEALAAFVARISPARHHF